MRRMAWLAASVALEGPVQLSVVRVHRGGALADVIIQLSGGLPDSAPPRWRAAGAEAVGVRLALSEVVSWSLVGRLEGGAGDFSVDGPTGARVVSFRSDALEFSASCSRVDVAEAFGARLAGRGATEVEERQSSPSRGRLP